MSSWRLTALQSTFLKQGRCLSFLKWICWCFYVVRGRLRHFAEEHWGSAGGAGKDVLRRDRFSPGIPAQLWHRPQRPQAWQVTAWTCADTFFFILLYRASELENTVVEIAPSFRLWKRNTMQKCLEFSAIMVRLLWLQDKVLLLRSVYLSEYFK